MNKNILLFGTLALIILLGSCSTKPVIISSYINAPVEHVTLSNQMQMMYDTIHNVNGGSVSIELPNGATILQLNIANLQDYIYVEPGQSIGVAVSNEGEISYTGGNQEAQNLIQEVSQKLAEANGKEGLPKLGRYEPKEFMDAVNNKYVTIENLIETSTVKDSKLKQWLLSRIEASKTVDIVNYPQFYVYYNDVEPPFEQELKVAKEKFEFDNRESYYFEESKTAAEAILMNDYNFYESPSISAYYADVYHNIHNYVKDPVIKEMLQYKILIDKITNSGGIDGMKEDVLTFIDEAKAPHRINTIRGLLNEWAHLEEGKPAPEFTAYTRSGDEVKLSDLQGKNVYIDVWATWCGPCIREIPSLKAMEEKYHDDNIEFVSVSIDRLSDKEKWSNFIDEKELKGLQIFAPNDWRSEIATNYNIKGIPRFIMVDDEGKIVSASAPRPSNTAGLEKMFAELLN